MSAFPISLVVVVDGEPLASSEVLATGFKQQHASVIKLVRKHQRSMEELGLVRFQIRPRRTGQHGGGDVEFALLNEHQTALLISLMRNTEKVVDFKVALIKEFFRMRDALNQRDKSLWAQMHALIAKEVDSKIRASFGSHLMITRKREIPAFEEERYRLESQIQPSLLSH
jgi:phage regulator Rha-like protein